MMDSQDEPWAVERDPHWAWWSLALAMGAIWWVGLAYTGYWLGYGIMKVLGH